MRLTRCIEADPGLAGLEQWMRSLGADWKTVLLAQQKAMFPLPCFYGLIWMFRNLCFQLDEPVWEGVLLYECPAIGVGGSHSDDYGEDGIWRCSWCGARPFWPVHCCSAVHASLSNFLGKYRLSGSAIQRTWPNLCTGWEVFATATYDGKATIGLCWVKP